MNSSIFSSNSFQCQIFGSIFAGATGGGGSIAFPIMTLALRSRLVLFFIGLIPFSSWCIDCEGFHFDDTGDRLSCSCFLHPLFKDHHRGHHSSFPRTLHPLISRGGSFCGVLLGARLALFSVFNSSHQSSLVQFLNSCSSGKLIVCRCLLSHVSVFMAFAISLFVLNLEKGRLTQLRIVHRFTPGPARWNCWFAVTGSVSFSSHLPVYLVDSSPPSLVELAFLDCLFLWWPREWSGCRCVHPPGSLLQTNWENCNADCRDYHVDQYCVYSFPLHELWRQQCVGFFWRGVVQHFLSSGIPTQTYCYWLVEFPLFSIFVQFNCRVWFSQAAVPIVPLGAPFGAFIASFLQRQVFAYCLWFLFIERLLHTSFISRISLSLSLPTSSLV